MYIILLVFLIFIYIRPKIAEYFTKNIIEFTNKQFIDPKLFISEYSEILENYSNYFNSKNLKKRQLENINELKIKYINALEKCNSYFIYKFNKNINSKLNNNILPFLDYIVPKSRITKINNIENNYPHTHKDIMFYNYIPDGYIIVHELVHIDQRYNEDFYNNIYTDWGFFKVDNINNFDNIRKINRTNPDGLNINWIWKYNNKYYWIGKLYDNNNNNISDATSKICEINKVGDKYFYNDIIDNLHNSKEYLDFFGNINGNDYHPNEICAEYFTKIIYNNNKAVYQAEKIFLNHYKKRFIKK